MRKLTQQEIDNAPDWATHYLIVNEVFMWESKTEWSHYGSERVMCNHGLGKASKPIPRKEFDIARCEFDGLSNVTVDGNFIVFEVVNSDDETTDVYIDKEFTIAAAKKFKLTTDDLK